MVFVYYFRFNAIVIFFMFWLVAAFLEHHNLCFIFVYFHLQSIMLSENLVYFVNHKEWLPTELHHLQKWSMNNSTSPDKSCIPCLPVSVISLASWLMNREKMVGLNTHPWRTPTGHSKKIRVSIVCPDTRQQRIIHRLYRGKTFPLDSLFLHSL